ncbi:hypothetical protein [Immundisolibacter sp.]|uniref:hypothetical protein n=1 Tax=Immundisolibacter sp. TaxID=1934948 RepID=UPI003565DC7B
MTLPGQANEIPPDPELLEFIAQWGDFTPLLDEPVGHAVADEELTPPTPWPRGDDQ